MSVTWDLTGDITSETSFLFLVGEGNISLIDRNTFSSIQVNLDGIWLVKME